MHHSKCKSLKFSELVFIIFEFLKFHLKFQELKLSKQKDNSIGSHIDVTFHKVFFVRFQPTTMITSFKKYIINYYLKQVLLLNKS